MPKFFTNSIKHPKEFNIDTGKTDLIKNIESVNQSIGLILLTSKGELYGDPEFGCNLRYLLFEIKNSALEIELKEDIVNALSRYEPRIIVTGDDISIESTDHITYSIKINYRMKYSDYESEYEGIVSEETFYY